MVCDKTSAALFSLRVFLCQEEEAPLLTQLSVHIQRLLCHGAEESGVRSLSPDFVLNEYSSKELRLCPKGDSLSTRDAILKHFLLCVCVLNGYISKELRLYLYILFLPLTLTVILKHFL